MVKRNWKSPAHKRMYMERRAKKWEERPELKRRWLRLLRRQRIKGGK
jgi:hypothetical protein